MEQPWYVLLSVIVLPGAVLLTLVGIITVVQRLLSLGHRHAATTTTR